MSASVKINNSEPTRTIYAGSPEYPESTWIIVPYEYSRHAPVTNTS